MTHDLRKIIADALQRHSSPTVGIGDIHGCQQGWIVYEGSLVFVAAAIAEAVDPVLKAQRDEIRAEFGRRDSRRMTEPVNTTQGGTVGPISDAEVAFLTLLVEGKSPPTYRIVPGRLAARLSKRAHFNGRTWTITDTGRAFLASRSAPHPHQGAPP